MVEQHIRVSVAAARLGISPKTFRRIIAAEGVPLMKIGNSYIVREEDVKPLIKSVRSIDEITDEMLEV